MALSRREKDTLRAYEKGEWVKEPGFPDRKNDLARYARNTLRKDRRLNIRISDRDQKALQRRAVREGLPDQTYVSSILHKFVNGSLREADK